MKNLLVAMLVTTSITSFAQSTRAQKNNEDANLCYFQQVKFKGYAYANLVGRCDWDPAMNGMYLSLTVVSEDPMQDSQKIEIGNILNVLSVKENLGQLQILTASHDMNENGEIIQIKKDVKVINVQNNGVNQGIFQVSSSLLSDGYNLIRSNTSSDACLDFLFGMTGSKQGLVKTVDVIENPSGVALRFNSSEVGDLSNLRSDFEVVAPNTYQVFSGVLNRELTKKFSTGLVKWTLKLEKRANGFKLTSTSRENFGLGKKSVVSCELTN
jgi:hypothetical protein